MAIPASEAGAGAAARDLTALPKAELHIHLEGAMRPQTLTDLCFKHGIKRPADTRGQRFENFEPFAACYVAVCECLREEADLRRLVREVAEDAAASGALWIEPALSFVFYAERFGGLAPTLRLLLQAAEEAEKATGVGIAYIVAAERVLPTSDAEHLARTVRDLVQSGTTTVCGHAGIIGFGLHANEVGHPPEPFAEAFGIACGAGLAAIPHAGELPPTPGGGPASVRFCVETLAAQRIEHGVLAAEDEKLVQELAARRVCLDVCPTSNVLLSVVPGTAEHPLPQLLRAGVPCSINSDDPLLFGCNLLSEYGYCREELGLSNAELAACACSSFEHSFAPEEVKQRGLAGIGAWLGAASAPLP